VRKRKKDSFSLKKKPTIEDWDDRPGETKNIYGLMAKLRGERLIKGVGGNELREMKKRKEEILKAPLLRSNSIYIA